MTDAKVQPHRSIALPYRPSPLSPARRRLEKIMSYRTAKHQIRSFAQRAGASIVHRKSQRTAQFALTAIFSAVLLTACGGGDDDNALNSNRFTAGSQAYLLAQGDDSPNAMIGGNERTYFWGLAGNDSIAAGSMGGNLFGDSGDDLLVGKAGPDRLVGGKGNDRLYGGAENDMLMGGEGHDFLDEGPGHGDLQGGPGNDALIGGTGADAFEISPDSGNDVIRDFTAGPGMFDHLAIRG
jgi:hypothetical protein